MDSPTVLIADDEPHITYLVRYKLEQRGITVLQARNGKEAWALAREQVPDAVVTDFQMPVMTGVEFAQELYAHPETAEVPVLLLTARSHKIRPSELARTNIQVFMAKPFSPRELIDHVSEMLASRQGSEVGAPAK